MESSYGFSLLTAETLGSFKTPDLTFTAKDEICLCNGGEKGEAENGNHLVKQDLFGHQMLCEQTFSLTDFVS